jgi:hypothetical protein
MDERLMDIQIGGKEVTLLIVSFGFPSGLWYGEKYEIKMIVTLGPMLNFVQEQSHQLAN